MKRSMPLVPVGEHEVEVVRALIECVPWRRFPENPRGECLRLTLSAGAEWTVLQQDIALSNSGLLDVVADAFGVRRQSLDPDQLVGKRARLRVRHVAPREVPVAIVERWLMPIQRSPALDRFQPERFHEPEPMKPPRGRNRRKGSPGKTDLWW